MISEKQTGFTVLMRIRAWLKHLKSTGICLIVYFLVKLIHKTLRYEVVGTNYLKETPQNSYAIASWHHNVFLAITSLIGQNVCLMVSPSFDGDIITWIARKLNLSTVRGSSSREGKSALLKLYRFLSQSGHIAIAVDGPRGPAFQAKPGIVFLAKKKQIPILPMVSIASRYWTLHKTWDRFRIPKPFATVHIYFASPILVHQTTDIKHAQKQLEIALHQTEKKVSNALRS